jgi:predicted CoA-binding protein
MASVAGGPGGATIGIMSKTDRRAIEQFLSGDSFAVVGASSNREKFGNKVLRAYLQAGRRVFPVNPGAKEIEGLTSYPDIASLPEPVHGISIVTPPEVTENIVEQAAAAGVRFIWMQPGAESAAAIQKAIELGLKLIHSGPCALVEQGFRES